MSQDRLGAKDRSKRKVVQKIDGSRIDLVQPWSGQ